MDDEAGLESESSEAKRGEVALVILLACILAVVMYWPLVLHLGEKIPQDLVDPLQQTWQVAWEGHAARAHPTQIFDSNAFWPLPHSLAYSDSLLGYLPAGLVGDGPQAALVRYNLLFLLTYVLPFAASYWLAREMGVGRGASLVAGAAVAYAPWRLAHNGHLNVLSGGAIPLTLFLLIRGYRRKKPLVVLAGWLAAAWQLSLGFSLGIPFAYLLVVLGAGTLVAWWIRGREKVARNILWATGIGVFLFMSVGVLQARPFLRVVDTFPDAKANRTEVWTDFFSPPPRGWLAAPSESLFWGSRTQERRDSLAWATEQAIFPGVTVVSLAVVGLLVPIYARWKRVVLAVATASFAVLAMGFKFAPAFYGFLYRNLPGWDVSRTPGRLVTFTTLGVALLAAAGAHHVGGRRKNNGSLKSIRREWFVIALALVVLLEGAGRTPKLDVPRVPPAQAGLASPQLHLPTDGFTDALYMFWSTQGWPEIVNGSLSFIPEQLGQLRVGVEAFPDAASVALLRDLGVKTVVLHPDRAPGTPWAESATRPVEGLGITRSETGDLIVFDLG